jgi:hypothetical protein
MTELEHKDIVGYLPYDLKGKYTDTLGNSHICTITNFESSRFGSFGDEKGKIMPILRPISDLYKTITHNGKEIVPIIELSKMSLKNEHYVPWDYTAWVEGCECFAGHEGYRPMYLFDYLPFKKSFSVTRLSYPKGGSRTFGSAFCENQWQLFDYMHELKIDYRDLMLKYLAIDCNTLEINPYK